MLGFGVMKTNAMMLAAAKAVIPRATLVYVPQAVIARAVAVPVVALCRLWEGRVLNPEARHQPRRAVPTPPKVKVMLVTVAAAA